MPEMQNPTPRGKSMVTGAIYPKFHRWEDQMNQTVLLILLLIFSFFLFWGGYC